MTYDFFADTIEIGVDDAEEVYTVNFTAASPSGGPAKSYLLLQRSVAGLDDANVPEPYVELNDPSYGIFANSVQSAELLPTYFHVQLKPKTKLAVESASSPVDVTEIVARYKADGPTLRRLKYAFELVIADGFPWRSIS
jgi:hypothetical protein